MNATNNTSAEPLTGAYRTADGKAQIEYKLRQTDRGPAFSATGVYDGGAGQCLDSIAAAYPSDEMVRRIVAVWKRYHLNGMNAGTPEQMAAVSEMWADLARLNTGPRFTYHDGTLNRSAVAFAHGFSSTFDVECQHLKGHNLYEVTPAADVLATGGMPEEVKNGARGYRYGERWIFAPIPADVLAEIRSWKDTPQPAESLYDANAAAFLERNGLKMRVSLSDTKPANWKPSGHHYRVTLSGKGRRIVFDFWGSVADAEAKKDPTPYTVLACLGSDAHAPETFTEYCREYGDAGDSIESLQTFKRLDRFAKRLRAFFTSEGLEELSEIQ